MKTKKNEWLSFKAFKNWWICVKKKWKWCKKFMTKSQHTHIQKKSPSLKNLCKWQKAECVRDLWVNKWAGRCEEKGVSSALNEKDGKDSMKRQRVLMAFRGLKCFTWPKLLHCFLIISYICFVCDWVCVCICMLYVWRSQSSLFSLVHVSILLRVCMCKCYIRLKTKLLM